MEYKHLLTVGLSLFDGAAGGGEGTAPAAGTGEGETTAAAPGPGGEKLPGPGGKRQSARSGDKVRYGKQPAPAHEAERALGQDQPTGQEEKAAETPEERRRRFRDLVSGEFKDLYTEDTQRIIDKRFRQTKLLEEQIGKSQPIIDMLMERYQIADGDLGRLRQALEGDSEYWTQAAREEGMSVEQYQLFRDLQRQNRALMQAQERRAEEEYTQRKMRAWFEEADQVREEYPDFDLLRESADPQFLALIRRGIPLRHAYEVLHMEDIKAGVARKAAQTTEKQVVDGIRAKGSRPAENGTSAQSAFTVKDDVSKLTKKDRAEIARRVQMGDREIRF